MRKESEIFESFLWVFASNFRPSAKNLIAESYEVSTIFAPASRASAVSGFLLMP